MKKVLLFLPGGFEILEASAFVDVIGWNYKEGDGTTKLFTCGFSKEVESSFGQKFIVDYLIDEVNTDSYHALALPGGFEDKNFYVDTFDQRFQKLINDFHNKQKTIASICVGAIPLAKSGILNNKAGNTYHAKERQENLKSLGVNVVDMPIVKSDNIITSAGPSTAIDVAFLLLELLTSVDNVNRVKKLMGYKIQ